MKEKNKKVASSVAMFLLIRWEQFFYSAEMQRTLLFRPLRLLMLRAVATLCSVCLCAMEDGRHGRPDLRREGVRWYSGHYPHCCRGMDVIVVE
jgi:hypothetical protein